MVKCYIDMDTVAYRSAASCEPTKSKTYREDLETAIRRADELMFRILSDCETDEYEGWLSGDVNFRKLLCPDYKANRANIRRPEWLQQCREFLVQEWGAKLTDGYEADDAIGIAWSGNGIICANDKDFRQLAGRHYNFVSLKWETVTDSQASLNFWCSMLIGDRADNIAGVPGIGETKAPRILSGLSERDMRHRVQELYEQYDLDFHLNYDLLHILRDEEEWFNIENKLREKQRQTVTEDSRSEPASNVPQPEC